MGLSIASKPVTRRIGVEIEGVGLDSREVARIAEAHGWSEVGDESLDDDRPAHHYATEAPRRTFEAVSPPLPPERRAEAPRMLTTLRRAGMRVNDSCGLHVHVDAKDLSTDALLHLLAHWYQNQANLMVMLGQRTDRLAAWVALLPQPMMRAFAELQPTDRAGVRKAWRKGCLAYKASSRLCAGLRVDEVERYWGLNFASLDKHGTVEFRAFEATTVPRRLRAYIALADALVERAVQAGPFTDWSLFQGRKLVGPLPRRVADRVKPLVAELGLPEWAQEHFVLMAEQAMWARTRNRAVSGDVGVLLGVRHQSDAALLEHDAMDAAHRTAEACLVGAQHLDLAGLSLTTLPPAVLKSRSLRTVDLRHNLITHRPQAPLHLKLDLEDNPALRELTRQLQRWGAEAEATGANGSMAAAQRVYVCVAKQQDSLSLRGWNAPPFQEHLGHVRHLTVEGRRTFPGWVRSMPQLQKLTLTEGSMIMLPSWLSQMPSLARIDIAGNRHAVNLPSSLRAAPSFWRIKGPVIFPTDEDRARYRDDGTLKNHLSRPADWTPQLARAQA